MSARAFAERGLIEHLKGFRWLGVYIHTNRMGETRYATYLIVPDEGSISGVILIPFSTTFDISNAASDIAVDIQTDASARWRPRTRDVRKLPCYSTTLHVPGQILQNAIRSLLSKQIANERLPSTKAEADRARVKFRLISIMR